MKVPLFTDGAWSEVAVRCNGELEGVFVWFPDQVMQDPHMKQRITEVLHASHCFGLVQVVSKEAVATRKAWGVRLGTGREGAVYRPNTAPDLAVKLFHRGSGFTTNRGLGVDVDGSSVLDFHSSRAGKGATIHNVLAAKLEDDPDLHTPRVHGLLFDPRSSRTMTVLDYVDGQPIDDNAATEVYGVANEKLEDMGYTPRERKVLLHDVKYNGGNVLRLADGTHSIIDR